MLWKCDGCGLVVESDPHGHSDWGGKITVYGPDCPECEIPTDYSGEGRIEDDYIVEEK